MASGENMDLNCTYDLNGELDPLAVRQRRFNTVGLLPSEQCIICKFLVDFGSIATSLCVHGTLLLTTLASVPAGSGTTRHQHDTASTSPGAIIDRRLRKDTTDRSTWNLSDFSTGILNFLLTIPSKLLCALVFIYRLRLVAAQQIQGVDGDDFANNLFTDLSPILALFGEQVRIPDPSVAFYSIVSNSSKVTKQFMAQATTWEDNILFAMVREATFGVMIYWMIMLILGV